MYDTSKLIKLFEGYNFGYKTSMETAYGNIYKPPLRNTGDKIMRYHNNYFWGDIPEDKYMLNHDNKGLTNSLKYWLQTKFPNKSKYESLVDTPETKCRKKGGG